MKLPGGYEAGDGRSCGVFAFTGPEENCRYFSIHRP